MKAGLVLELSDYYGQWGVNPADFNPGGMARAAPEGDIAGGIYGVGDGLFGNILVYNKAMFDQAGLEYPSADQSLTWPQYADLCRKLGKPDRNPANAVYGCSAPDFAFGIWGKWYWGPDGHQAMGNMNSDPVVQAWNIGTALVRDGYAPTDNILQGNPAGVSDLFAQGKVGMTWSDFSEVPKYTANNINFGLAPFMVIEGSESFVDTWTTPWGTFRDSPHQAEALKFLQFIATDAQRIRAEVSADPPLSMKVAQELGWGQGDPIKEQYLQVLQQAKPQVFVPPLPEGAFDAAETYRQMTVERKEDVKPMLDEAATKTQPLLDKAWQDWEALAPAA
jgi:multiple sugar transport system substrate-binding protein